MRERPIIFSGPMVRAILEGRKAQTRRVLKMPAPAPYAVMDEADDGKPWPFVMDEAGQYHAMHCPYGNPGDLLWVRESWGYSTEDANEGDTWPRWVSYRADGAARLIDATGKVLDRDFLMSDEDSGGWRSPIFMPRWASRLTLEVVSVKVERLQDISEEDARAEGMERLKSGRGWYNPTVSKGAVHMGNYCASAREAFTLAWEQINGGRPRRCWDDNPWVWCVTFRKSEKA